MDWEMICRRAGGRRRYNAIRQRCAEQRRAAMAEVVNPMGVFALLNRGLAPALARAFGVSRQTAWRDLQYILYGGQIYIFSDADGELLFTVTRAYSGGPILSVTDPDDNEICGAARRDILRRLPRYFG